MKKYFVVLILMFPVLSIYAQNDGAANTGMSFLKLGVTSRAVALGEAVVSFTDDASATHYNPANLFLGSNVNVMFMHNEQVLGIRTEFLAGKVKYNKFAFGFHMNSTSISDIEVREIPGPPQDVFTAQNFDFALSGAYKINDNIQFGVTTKFLYEKIYINNASGYAFDFGGLYHKDKFAAGISFANYGSMGALVNEKIKLPASVRLGASYLFDIPKLNGGLRAAIDGFKVNDGGKFHINGGAEFVFRDLLSIRAGYQTGYDDRSFTTGIGIKYKAFNLDYAFVPYKYSLGNSHTFTLGTSF
jgi:hypothetical protein